MFMLKVNFIQIHLEHSIVKHLYMKLSRNELVRGLFRGSTENSCFRTTSVSEPSLSCYCGDFIITHELSSWSKLIEITEHYLNRELATIPQSIDAFKFKDEKMLDVIKAETPGKQLAGIVYSIDTGISKI